MKISDPTTVVVGETSARPAEPTERTGPSSGLGRTLVVGATSGIGRALVAELGRRAVPVVGAGRKIEKLAGLPGVTPIGCDATSVSDVEHLVEKAVDCLGGLDAVVYAAGMTGFTPLGSTSLDRWRELYEANLFGAVSVVRQCLPHLTGNSEAGRVALLTSDSAQMPYPGLVAYATSKAALAAFGQGLRNEVPALHVTEIVVGPTDETGMFDQLDPEALGPWIQRWADEGYLRYDTQRPDDVVDQVVRCLADPAPPHQVVAARPLAT